MYSSKHAVLSRMSYSTGRDLQNAECVLHSGKTQGLKLRRLICSARGSVPQRGSREEPRGCNSSPAMPQVLRDEARTDQVSRHLLPTLPLGASGAKEQFPNLWDPLAHLLERYECRILSPLTTLLRLQSWVEVSFIWKTMEVYRPEQDWEHTYIPTSSVKELWPCWLELSGHQDVSKHSLSAFA